MLEQKLARNESSPITIARREPLFTNRSDMRMQLTKVVVFDCEGLTVDIRWDANLPVYCVCLLEIDEDNKRTLRKYYTVATAISRLQLLLNSGWLAVAHNAKFDLGVLKVRGLQHTIVPGVLSVADTMVMEYTYDTTQKERGYSLQALTGQKSDVQQAFVDAGLLESKVSDSVFWSTDWSDNKKAIELITDYCAQDIRATWGLYKRLARLYNSEPRFIATLAYLEFPMLDVLTELETSGMYINTQRLSDITQSLTQQKHALEQQIAASAGLLPKLQWDGESYQPVSKCYKGGAHKSKTNLLKHYIDNDGIVLTQWVGFIPGSDDGTVVYDHTPLMPYNSAAATGHTWWLLKRYCPDVLTKAETTKTGKPQLNKDYLKDVGDDIPSHLPLATLAKVNKLLSMCENISEHVRHDGRLHSSFQNTTTRTTRLACVQPNMQQMPRVGTMVGDVDYGKEMRSLFAASEGNSILVADLN